MPEKCRQDWEMSWPLSMPLGYDMMVLQR